MGYRSEVGILIEGSAEAIANAKALIPVEIIKEFFDFEFEVEEERIKFYADDVKWYDSFPEVVAMEKWFADVEGLFDDGGTNLSLRGKFLRIGEECGDVEERYFGDDDIYDLGLSQKIVWY